MEIHIKNNKKILISRLVLNLKPCSEKSTKTYLSIDKYSQKQLSQYCGYARFCLDFDVFINVMIRAVVWKLCRIFTLKHFKINTI